MFEEIGLVALVTVGAVAIGFCWGIGFWMAKRVVRKLNIKIDLQRKETT